MRRSSLLIAIFLLVQLVPGQAQTIRPLQTGPIPDSSYYDIVGIGDGLFWAAGENGLLKEIDSNGKARRLDFPYPEINLLKILSTPEAIFLGGDQGMLIRYDRASQTFERSYFPKKFGNRCFYDMIQMDDGTLLVSGGNQRIAKAGKALPQGFIAKVDPRLQSSPQIVWESAVHFVWTLERNGPDSQEYLASAYSGLRTTILSSINDGHTWQNKTHIPALVHHLYWDGDEMWFSGSRNLFFASNGRVGKLNGDEIKLEAEGCVWTLIELDGKLHGLTYNGSVVELDPVSATVQKRYRPTTHALYEAVPIDGKRALLVGHGQQLFLMDLRASAIDISK